MDNFSVYTPPRPAPASSITFVLKYLNVQLLIPIPIHFHLDMLLTL